MNRYVLALLPVILFACALPLAETAPIEHVGAARAAVTTCVTLPALADAGVLSSVPTTNNGSGAAMGAALLTGPAYKHGFITYDVSTLPSGAALSSASLNLFASAPSGSPTVNAHAVGASWVENTITWATAPAYGATIGSMTGAATGARTLSISTTTVAGWMSGPNYGVTLEADAGGALTFATREATTSTQRPTLSVCYTSGAALGASCSVNGDCASNICGAGLCVAPGGESVSVISTCSWLHDGAIAATTYSYGADPANLIDVYMPTGAAPAGGWPLVVNVHGGGFASSGGGRGASALSYFCQVLASNLNGIPSVACASIDYRLMTGHYPTTVNPYPAQVNDGLAAQAWLVANASTLGIDTARIAWAGYSAGGHVATKVAASTMLPRVARVVTYYPNTRFDDPSLWSASNPILYDYAGCANGDGTCLAAMAPTLNAAPAYGDPPWFGSHDALDSTVLLAQSTSYQAALRAVGTNATLITIPGVNAHGYGPTFGGPATSSTCTDVYGFLQGF